jgi:uncharacterized protein (TIGR02246 family)
MKQILRLAAVAMWVVADSSGAGIGADADADGAAKADAAAIRALVDQAVRAWGKGDGAAYAAVFDDDADYVTFGGMHLKGRGAIAKQHQQLFDTALKGTRLQLRITNLRFLTPNVALTHAVGGILDEPGQTEVAPTRNSLQILVWRKRDGAWRCAALQVTRIR